MKTNSKSTAWADKLDLPNEFVIPEVSKRAKRLTLRLDNKNRTIRFIIPQKASLKKAQSFIDQNYEWINSQIDNLPEPVHYRDGTIIPVCGVDYEINIQQSSEYKNTKVYLTDDQILVKTNRSNPQNRIERFLKNHIKQVITTLAHEKAEKINQKVSRVTIRDTASRWGSCSSAGSLSFSWRLVFAPYHTLDYLVAHEVAHLQHMDHSRAFWTVCEALSESYKDGKQWIKNHGHTLMRYGYESDNLELIEE